MWPKRRNLPSATISTIKYSELARSEITKKQLDSLFIEAENLNVCEECELKEWKWVKIRLF